MTIKDVAKNLNLSIATISRALNGTGKVKEETKKEILEYINEVGYTPNAIARNLSTKNTKNIAIIVPNIANSFFGNLINCICKQFNSRHYNITLYNTDDNVDIESEAIKNIAEQRVNAVIAILVKSNYFKNPLQMIENLNIPCILLDRDLEKYNFPGVFLDNFVGSYNITKKLLEEGHKNIGLISGSDEITTSKERLEGYLEAHKDFGVKINLKNIFKGEFNFETGEKAIEILLKQNITALYATNNQMFLGAVKKIIADKKIKLACFEKIDFLEVLGIKILSCNIPVEEIAISLVQIFESGAKEKRYIKPLLQIK